MFNIPSFEFGEGNSKKEGTTNYCLDSSDSDEETDDEGPPALAHGHGGGRESGKSHFVLVNSKVCRGWIGGSQKHRFCLEKKCGVATHKGVAKKMAMEEDEVRLYVKAIDGHRGEQAFAKPSLNVLNAPKEQDIDELIQQWDTVDALRLYVQEHEIAEVRPIKEEDDDSYKSANDEMLSVAPVGGDKQSIIDCLCEGASTPLTKNLGEEVGIELAKVENEGAVAENSTPGATGAVADNPEDALVGLKELEGLASEIPNGEESPWGEIKKLERILTSQLEKLTKLVVVQESAHQGLVGRVDSGFRDIDVKVVNANRAVRMISGRLGETNGAEKGQPLWEAIDLVKDGLADVKSNIATKEDVKQSVAASFGIFKARVEDSVQKAHVNLLEKITALEESTGKAFKGTWDGMTKLNNSVAKKINAVSNVHNIDPLTAFANIAGSGHGGNVDVVGSPEHQTLVARLEALEQAGNLPPVVMNTDNECVRELLSRELDNACKRAQHVESKITSSRTFKSDDGVFTCEADVRQFLEENELDNLEGMIEVFSLFALLKQTALSGSESAKRVYNSKQIGRTAAESDLLAAHSHDRPAPFFSSSADLNPNKLVKRNKGFGASVDTYNAHEGSSTAWKHTLEDWIEDLASSLRAELDMTNKVDRLKACFIRKAIQHARKLLDYPSVQHRHLTVVCKYADKSAWASTGRNVAAFFLALKAKRAEAAGLEDLRRISSQTHFLWTVVQVHCVADDIFGQGFNTHPLVAAEIMDFQQENRVDAAQLTQVKSATDTRLNGFQSEIAELKTSIRAVERTADAASRQAQQAKQDHGNIKTDFNNLKSKNSLK